MQYIDHEFCVRDKRLHNLFLETERRWLSSMNSGEINRSVHYAERGMMLQKEMWRMTQSVFTTMH
ncbi:hypothetical protein [Croceibacterium xixiisoli]|uniref:hypothetical protein n=1 Tax=Croceibacterium xixiisoli TaxID=1476466 RepID=UPI001F37AAD0|nr:hypothetical protein [Croceibacterium xixiisoli]